MTTSNYQEISSGAGTTVRAWVSGVPFDDGARTQLQKLAQLPILAGPVAAMPDVHKGIGATVGSVIATKQAIIPAAVGVDIGCGMMAVRTSLTAEQLPDNPKPLRMEMEAAVPHGRTSHGGRNDRGRWGTLPNSIGRAWKKLDRTFKPITDKYKHLGKGNEAHQLGTLGSGNHFIELCLDESNDVWVMLHSGSRGVGNRIGRTFIEMAKKDMRVHKRNTPDADLAYLQEGTEKFDDYIEALLWAQNYAATNRQMMMDRLLDTMRRSKHLPSFKMDKLAVNCHHNYAQEEVHNGQSVWLTRKGAVSARVGEFGIIPGSMGARSFIVEGKGNPDSYCSCSHGAGRVMSRTRAKKHFSLDDHIDATKGVECRKDEAVLDETPGAYKDIDAVMAAQSDLIRIVHTLKQVVCIKG